MTARLLKCRLFFCFSLCSSTFSCGELRAELPHIRLDGVFPLGAQAGSEVVVEISGKDLDEVKSLHFDHPGFKAAHIKGMEFRVTIPVDAVPGSHEVRAVGKYGISGARLFAVGRGLSEVGEAEPNDSPDKAQPVPLNSAVNGHSDNNGDDFFRFAATKGQRVVIDCQALRLDSTLRALLTLSAADGTELLRSRPYYHRTDPLLDFQAPADGEYVLRLHDATFLGGLPYRLLISTHPQIENAFPAAVRPGEKTELQMLGRNLPGGKAAPAWSVQDQPLEQLTVSFTAPTDPVLLQRFSTLNHLASPSLNARGLQFWPEGLTNALNPVTLILADAPVTLDREPNDSPESAQAVALPTVISGRLDRPGDADWYSFTGKRGDSWSVDLLCERMDLPGDPFVIVTDDKGKEVAAFDDHGINRNSLAQANRDPLGTFNVPADGVYRILVQERYRHGGARYQYVLRLVRSAPDFYPVVFHETPADPSCPVVRQGGSAFYEVCLNRRDYNGPVTVEAEGLPTGVSCRPVHVSPQSPFASVVFTAADDAPEWAGSIRLKAWAVIDGKRLEREVRCSERRWPIANVNTSVAVREVCLAVRPRAPYGLKLPEGKLTVQAGGTAETSVTVVRHWPEFKDAVQVTGLELPPGFTAAAAEITADKTEAAVKLTVAANVPPGEYSVVMRGSAQVPFARDPAGPRANVRVADPSTPLTVIVTAPAKKG